MVLSTEGDGAPAAALLSLVDETIQPRRPLTDHVLVEGAAILAFSVEAELTLYSGPDAGLVLQAAEEALEAYLDAHHRLGHDITRSGLFAALHQPGVQNVTITQPAADLVVAPDQVAYCASDALAVSIGGA